GCAGDGPGDEREQVAEVLLQFAKFFGGRGRSGFVDAEGKLRLFVAKFGFEDLARAGNGVALVVKKRLDTQHHLDVAAAVEALAGAAFVRLKLGKFAFPETKDVCRKIAELGDFADAEVELVRDFCPGWRGSSADWLVLRHA